MEGVSRINRLVKTLNAFIHLDEAAYKAVDINKGIQTTVALLKEQFTKGINFDLKLNNLPLIICHPAQINQAMMSLLHYRARKMNGLGTLSIRSELRGNYIHIKITDHGPVISPEERMKIFNPTLDTQNDRIELNMDLTISYKIIERHRGSIIIESAPERGTDIHIELPVNS